MKIMVSIPLAEIDFFQIAGAVSLLGISSSVSLAVPFCMGRLIDLVHTAAAQGGMEETLMKVSIGLSVIFVIGAAANMGRVYLLQLSGKDAVSL